VPSVADVLATRKGLIVAPAGCGKTHLIMEALAERCDVPALVLTHTTAGVAALRHRLKGAGVPSSNYRLNTIAGWALNIISMFPERAEYTHNPLEVPKYTDVQRAVGSLCHSGHIDNILLASYSRLLVDEYQDCSTSQHEIVEGIARVIPTVIFGDPLQAVFDFIRNDRLPNWPTIVETSFPKLGELTTPWRWDNAKASDLGVWLLRVRETLLSGKSIDLRSCSNRVFWTPLTSDVRANMQAQVNAQSHISRRHPHEKLLIIGDPIHTSLRHQYASRAHGVVEPVDFKDVVSAASEMANLSGDALLQHVLRFLAKVMVNVYGDVLLKRVPIIISGKNRTDPTHQELVAMKLYDGGGFSEAVKFMLSMKSDANRRIYRYSAFNVMLEAMKMAALDVEKPLDEIVALLREQRRHAGRAIPYKAVGSTLLLKGLEAEHVLILDASRMSRENLYVALSRGAKSITIFSSDPILP